eukprot:1781442-Lingulodinium_polyedra.AAC.1
MAERATACARETRTVRLRALAQRLSRPISLSVSTAGACLGFGKWAQATACQSRGGVCVTCALRPA